MADSKFTQAKKALMEVVGGVTQANGYDFTLEVEPDRVGEQSPRPWRAFVYSPPMSTERRDTEGGGPEDRNLYQRTCRFIVEVGVPGRTNDPGGASVVDEIMLNVGAAIEKEINNNPCLKTAQYPQGAAALTWVGETANMIESNPPTIYLEVLAAVTYLRTEPI